MKHMNQMTITDSATLNLSGNDYGASFSDACTRFFKSASMLPPAASLGMRISFCHDEVPSVAVFSDAGLGSEDYTWMFKPCAKIVYEKMEDNHSFTESRTYFIAGNDLTNTDEKAFSFFSLVDELRTLGAVLTILVPSCSNCAYVSLEAAQELPLRVRVMLSISFRGAGVFQSEGKVNESEKGVPCEAASENIESLLTVIAGKSNTVEMDEYSIDQEPGEIDENEYSIPIEELDFSVRTFACLKRAGIHTIGMLRAMSRDELNKVHNLSRKSYEEVVKKLEEYKLTGLPECATEDLKSGKEMLNELIGLEEVKTQVRRITALAKMQQDMKNKGLNAKPIALNMAFVGNPGTAKTTVARIMAKVLCEANLLRKPRPIEVGRADIVARYVGQTADNVKAIFRQAEGGLLFIDEAYSLLDDFENGYGDEAINTIVQEMENCRDDTVVVFAGYPKPMEEFLSRNSGLRSRVPFHINFTDYSADEMTQIAALTAEQRGFSIHPQALEKLTAICEEAGKNVESGNGRFCRNLVENAILSFADRIFGENKAPAEINYVLLPDDFNVKPTAKKEKNRVGFC